MRITYPGAGSEDEVDAVPLLVSDRGSYILSSEDGLSSYEGVALLDRESFASIKVVHGIGIPGRPEECIIGPRASIRRRGDVTERLFFSGGHACIGIRGQCEADITLDLRHLYDMRTQGREHSIHVEGDGPYIARIRCRDREALLLSTAPLHPQQGWVERSTPFDARRGGSASWWVHNGLRVDVSSHARIIVCWPDRVDRASLLLEDDAVWNDGPGTFSGDRGIAEASLHGLLSRTPQGDAAILAGLPWFFQVWSRDEAISCGALIALGRYRLAASILLRQIGDILDDGRVPNRFPASEVGSADGVGWAFTRLSQLLHTSPDIFDADGWSLVLDRVQASLHRLHRNADGLVVNGPQETWMDTLGGTDDDRRGARIEVQALTLRMLRLAADLSERLGGDASLWREREEDLAATVRRRMHDPARGLLADGMDHDEVDWTIRPNALLARYIYPWLLSHDDWVLVCDTALSHLHTDWSGGLATIDREHPLFCKDHTGASDRSYHRGDAWYYVDNLVAVGLHDLDADRYQGIVEAIRDAGLRDMRRLGAPGHCSEISGASRQEALGCFQQAWSAATLIELLSR